MSEKKTCAYCGSPATREIESDSTYLCDNSLCADAYVNDYTVDVKSEDEKKNDEE